MVGYSPTQGGFHKDKVAKAMEWRHKVIFEEYAIK
jgi:hypothetical protein